MASRHRRRFPGVARLRVPEQKLTKSQHQSDDKPARGRPDLVEEPAPDGRGVVGDDFPDSTVKVPDGRGVSGDDFLASAVRFARSETRRQRAPAGS